MKYNEFKDKLTKEINDFPFIFAFSKQQLHEGMEKVGLKPEDTDKIMSIGAGGYIKKSDEKKLDALYEKHNQLRLEQLKDDEFVVDAMIYELGNHEFCITYDPTDALLAIGLSTDKVENDERLLSLFCKARKLYLDSCNE